MDIYSEGYYMRPHLCFLAVCVLVVAGCTGKNAIPGTTSSSAALQAQSSSPQVVSKNETSLQVYPVPQPFSFPFPMAVGPDNAIWFGLFNSVGSQDGDLGRLNADGTITTIDVPPTGSAPFVGTVTPDGRLWFGIGGNVLSRVNAAAYLAPGGAITSFQFRQRRNPDYVRFSALGTDGNVWFVLSRANAVARVTPSGSITEFQLPPTSVDVAHPNGIVVGSDGAFWITAFIGNAIMRMTTDGTVTNSYMLSTEAFPWDIAEGDDGNVWFTQIGSQANGDSFTPPAIIRMTTSGQTTAFSLPSGSYPISISHASNGLVFTDPGNYSVGLMDYSGNLVELPIHGEYPLESTGNGAQAAIQGVDGSYYYTDLDNNQVGKITLGDKGMIFPKDFIMPAGNSQLVGVGVLGDRGPFKATVDDPTVATISPMPGFPMNFTVTGISPGTTTLEIHGKGKPMTAAVTVIEATANAQLTARKPKVLF
jgi:virginiamycin B lyase